MSITELRHAAVRKARADNPYRRQSPEAWAAYKAAIDKVCELYGPGPYWGSGMSAAEIKADRAAAVAAGTLTARDAAAGGMPLGVDEKLMPLGDVVASSPTFTYVIIGAIILGIILIFRKH